MVRIKRMRYSPAMAKRMFTKYYYRILDGRYIIGEAQTKELAKKMAIQYKRRKRMRKHRR